MAEKRFARVLSRLRKEQGFATALAFYRQRGGRAVLGSSFANYAKLERGASLPHGRRLDSLLKALGVAPASPAGRELISAFLYDTTGSQELVDALAAGSADPAPPSWLAAETAARQAISQRTVQLTMDQYAAIASSADAYACHAVLANTRAWMTREELSGLVGLKGKPLDAAVKRLSDAGLVEQDAGKVRSPLAGKFVAPPAATPAMASLFARLMEHRKRWLEKGRGLDYRYLILRASRARFASYLAHLADVVQLSAVYGDVEPGPDSEMYLVEGRVTRVFAPEKR